MSSSFEHAGGPHVVRRPREHEGKHEHEHGEEPEDPSRAGGHGEHGGGDGGHPGEHGRDPGEGGQPGADPTGLTATDNPLLGGHGGGHDQGGGSHGHEHHAAGHEQGPGDGGVPSGPVPGALQNGTELQVYDKVVLPGNEYEQPWDPFGDEASSEESSEPAIGCWTAQPPLFKGLLIAFGVLVVAGVISAIAGGATNWFRRRLRFTSTPPSTATVGVVYEATIETADDVEGRTRAITAPLLPAWLTLVDKGDGTATLSGTPTTAGAERVELRLAAGEDIDELIFTLTVTGVAPAFVSMPPTNAVVGVRYAYRPVVVAGADTVTLTASGLPGWLQLGTDPLDNATIVAGTPATGDVGTSTFTLTAAVGQVSVEQQVTVTVVAMTIVKPTDPTNPTDPPPPTGTPTIAFTTTPRTTAVVGKPFVSPFAASASDGSPVTLRLVETLRWATLVSTGTGTAELRGTPAANDVGMSSVTVLAARAADPTVATPQTFTLRVVTLTWKDLLDGNGKLRDEVRSCLEGLAQLSEDAFWDGAIAAVGSGTLPCVDEQGVTYGRMPYEVQLTIARFYLAAAVSQLPGGAISGRDRAGEDPSELAARLRRAAGNFPTARTNPDPDPVTLWTAASKLKADDGTARAPALPRAVRLDGLVRVLQRYVGGA